MIDDPNNLLYATVRYNNNSRFYGIVEINLDTGAKTFITNTSQPISLPQEAYSGYYFNGYRIDIDPIENKIYMSSNAGLWWWDRDNNSTGIINTEGGINLLPGNPQLPSNRVSNIYIDEVENKFYIGTWEGLYVWDRTNNTSRVYNKDNSLMIDNLVNHI